MYETFIGAIFKPRPIDEVKALFEHAAGKYPKCFMSDFYERQPLSESVVDDLAQREGWSHDTAKAVIKYYHWPWQFRSRFQDGLNRINLDGKVVGRLSVEDADAVRSGALTQMREMKEKGDRIKNSGANIPVTILPKVKLPPEKPAVSILSGIKEMKARLLADVSELQEKIQDLFPEELIELFPDLERSISKLMEGAEEVVAYCKPKTNGKSHDHEARV
jgi:sRNA-binding protein